jgi:broad specificity phosphatase PhoE
MTTAFFLRHGPTQENIEERIQGHQPGTLLVQETEQYLAAVVPLLRPKSPAVLISSDLDRAVKTRDILKQFLQLPDIKEEVSPLLREKAMGFYEGMLWSEVPPSFREERDKSDYDFRKFGGENNEDVRERVKAMLRQLAQRYSQKRVCCITHAGWLSQLVKLAGTEGVLSDGWSKRTAIYEAGIGPVGQLQYFHPIILGAQLPRGDE